MTHNIINNKNHIHNESDSNDNAKTTLTVAKVPTDELNECVRTSGTNGGLSGTTGCGSLLVLTTGERGGGVMAD